MANNRWPADAEDAGEHDGTEGQDRKSYTDDLAAFARLEQHAWELEAQLDSLVKAVKQVLPNIGQSADNDVLRKEVERAEALLRSIK